MSQDISTKERIFRKSIHLFAEDGFDSVSMRQIATACGIQPASIYNHYPAKEEILQSIYQYYVRHQNDCRPQREAYLPVLRRGTAMDILGIFNYPMPDEGDPDPLMFDIIRIFWSRIHTDPVAMDLYRTHVVEEACRYIDEVMRAGIEMGRVVMKEADIYTFACVALAVRNYVASSIPLYPDVERWRGTGGAMMQMLAD
ncbi:MAG: TetR/AcrR family transcriptional regulator, partial [Oscillospiraceae bacterium]